MDLGALASDYLGEFEHLVLLAVMRLEGEAYGAPIRRLIAVLTGSGEAAVHAAQLRLRRMSKGLIEPRRG